MVKGQIPDGEGLKLGISGPDTSLILMVELGEAGGHLSASRSRSRNHYKRTGGLDEIILAVAIITYNKRNVVRISGDHVMAVYLNPDLLQSLLE